jgi:hypothetical protein
MRYLKTYENFEQPEGTGTESSWEVEIDGNPVKVTLTELIDYIDGVVEIDPNEIKELLIDTDRDPKRVDAADLDYPIILSMKNGEYKNIIDGQHRVVKALKDEVPLKAKILNLDDAPEKYRKIFDSKSNESYFNLYLDSKIGVDELINSLELRIDENIISNFKSFIDKGKKLTEESINKILGWISKQLEVESYIFDKIIENLKKVGSKIIELLLAVLKRIKDFKDKHPKIFKAIVIILTIVIIILISAVVAYSQTTGQPVSIEEFGINSEMLDAMIGFSSQYKLDPKIQAALVDLKDGSIDLDWNNVETSKSYIESIRKSMISMKDEEYFWHRFSNWIEIGEKYVDVIHKKVTMVGQDSSFQSDTYSFYTKK